MGRLLGIDRLPEVKTLRVKITLLACASAAPPESMLALKKKDHARRAAA